MAQQKISNQIKKLPAFLIDQIKAGEVIESPSSLLKELIENSIDANSTSISITIINNGITKISISDNGKGIAFDQLPLAFHRHATSKITDYDDLYKLHSFGFRGEALASVASISRVQCVSSPINQEGGKINIEGGEIASHTQMQLDSQGTTITISDLFFNTPVRMKFIKGQKSEKKAINRILFAYILSNPDITFTIKWDEEEKKIYSKIESPEKKLAQRAVQVFPWLKSSDDLLIFEQSYNEHTVKGIIQKSSSRSTKRRANYLFANNRLFTEQSYHYLITQLGKQIWNEGEQGSYILFLDIPPHSIDVNIHPSKTRIKFAHATDVYALISSAVKNIVSSQKKSFDKKKEPNYNIPLELDNTSANASSTSQLASQILTPVFEGISIFKYDDSKFFLIDEKELFIALLDSAKDSSDDDNNLIPLMVTVPFTIHTSSVNIISFFSQYGIYFEKLSETTLLLKTLPKQISQLSLRNLFQIVFSSSSKVLNNKFYWKTILPDQFSYQEILRDLPFDELTAILVKNLEKWQRIDHNMLRKLNE